MSLSEKIWPVDKRTPLPSSTPGNEPFQPLRGRRIVTVYPLSPFCLSSSHTLRLTSRREGGKDIQRYTVERSAECIWIGCGSERGREGVSEGEGSYCALLLVSAITFLS